MKPKLGLTINLGALSLSSGSAISSMLESPIVGFSYSIKILPVWPRRAKRISCNIIKLK